MQVSIGGEKVAGKVTVDVGMAKPKTKLEIIDEAVNLAKAGNMNDASKLLVSAGGMTQTQALENLSAYAKKAEPVNTSSPTGMWGGAVTQGNIAGAPVSTTAALQTTATKPPVTPPAPQTQAPTTTAFAPVTPKTPQVPAAQPFQYQPSTPVNNAEDVARRNAEQVARNRREALAQALARRMLGYQQSADALPQQLNEAWKMNDEEAARSGFLTSGRRFALRDKSNTAMLQELAKIQQARNLSLQEAADTENAIAQDQADLYLQRLDALRRDDRNFGLQERGQQYQEYMGGLNYGLNAAQANLALQRGYGLLPYELEGAALGNQGQYLSNLGAQYGLYDNYSPGGLGYQSRAAQVLGQNIANQTNQAQYQDQYTPGGLGYQMRQGQLNSTQLANVRTQLDNQLKQLEYTIAQNPQYGLTVQAQMALDKAKKDLAYVDAQIASTYALANDRNKPDPTKETFTATTVSQRWGIQPTQLGMTSNYAAFDKKMTEWAPYIQQGATYQDVYDYVTQNRDAFLQNGIDPSAFLSVIKLKNFPNTTE